MSQLIEKDTKNSLRLARLPLRLQLGFLVLAILVPVFGAMGWYLVQERHRTRDRVVVALSGRAELIAVSLRAFLDRNEGVLGRLAQRPLVSALDPSRCDPILQQYASLQPEFINVVVRDLRGNTVCAMHAATASSAELAAFPWFKETLASSGFHVSDAFFGPVAKRWVIMLSHPVHDVNGVINGFVMVPVDLLKLSQSVLAVTPQNVIAVVNDRQPRIILRSTDPEAFIGKSTPSTVANDTRGQGLGSVTTRDAQGVLRLWAFSTLPPEGWRVAVGIREDDAFAASDRAFRNGLVAGAAILLASLLLAWRIGRRIARPIAALADVSARVASGDRAARAPLGTGAQEFEIVARAFNRMLDVRGLAEATVVERERRLNFLLSRTSAAIFTSKAWGDFAFTFVSDSVENLTGCSVAEFMSTPNYWSDHIHPDDLQRFRSLKSILMDKGFVTFEYRFMHKDGNYRWIRDEMRCFRDAAGEPVEVIGFLVDINESRHAQDLLRANEERFRSLVDLSSDWYWEQDAQFRFVSVDGGVSSKGSNFMTENLGKTRWDIEALNMSPADWDHHRAVLNAHESFRDLVIKRPDNEGRARWMSVSGSPIFDDQGVFQGYRGVGRDITAQEQAAERINWLAFYDPLTELPNRRLLSEKLKKALLDLTRSGCCGALLFIDLDNFKTLNDTLGHDTGDLLLQQVAIRLVTCVRGADTVARQGGDEFVVILEGLDADESCAAAHAEAVGQKILSTLNEPYMLGGRAHRSTPSIGITLFGRPGLLHDELLKQADLAMYQAKAAGRNTLRFFDAQMQADVSNRVVMEAELGEGLLRGEMVLHYQPVMYRDGSVTGAEALVRWQHPQRGLVWPGEFVALAESTGQILPMGRWVLESACKQLVAWASRAETRHLTLAVNVSTTQFSQPDFVAEVEGILAATGACADLLRLELTESLLAHDMDDIIVKMSALKVRGVRFSLDDFGTGYSSLSYLKRLPLDQLKIDKSFVRDVLVDPNDAAIARTIVALGESLSLSVVAEGVETEGQHKFLAANGVDAYQGYLFSRPLPIADFDAFVLAKT